MHAHSTIRYEDLRAILLDYYREHKPRSRNAIQAKRIATEISSLKKFLLAPTSWIGFQADADHRDCGGTFRSLERIHVCATDQYAQTVVYPV